jgi:serine kinase of HPr protein (carbohydrate metabolism regulator)
MSRTDGETVHASAVLVGNRAVLIRGPTGSGKSRLALALIEAGSRGRIPFARLVADDRVRLRTNHGRLLVEVPQQIRDMVEVRGLGIRRLQCEPRALVGLVVDLAAKDGTRTPEAKADRTEILGVALPRAPIAAGAEPLPIVMSLLSSLAAP